VRRTSIAVALALMTLACGRSPSAPTGVALVCTPTTVIVARNATSAVTVHVQRSNGTKDDVTATAVWSSSVGDLNEQYSISRVESYLDSRMVYAQSFSGVRTVF
jgi:hypothetical protein